MSGNRVISSKRGRKSCPLDIIKWLGVFYRYCAVCFINMVKWLGVFYLYGVGCFINKVKCIGVFYWYD